jgi:hypothetical protein
VVHVHTAHPPTFRRNFNGHSRNILLFLSVLGLGWGEIESVGTAVAKGLLEPASDRRMEHWWNDDWQGKPEVFGEKFASVLFAHHIFKMDCPGNINL